MENRKFLAIVWSIRPIYKIMILASIIVILTIGGFLMFLNADEDSSEKKPDITNTAVENQADAPYTLTITAIPQDNSGQTEPSIKGFSIEIKNISEIERPILTVNNFGPKLNFTDSQGKVADPSADYFVDVHYAPLTKDSFTMLKPGESYQTEKLFADASSSDMTLLGETLNPEEQDYYTIGSKQNSFILKSGEKYRVKAIWQSRDSWSSYPDEQIVENAWKGTVISNEIGFVL